MYKLNEEDSKTFIAKKVLYDSLCQAYKIAKQLPVPSEEGVYEKELEVLYNLKTLARTNYLQEKENILHTWFKSKCLIKSTNMIDLGNSWKGICYTVDSKRMDLKVDYVMKKDVSILERSEGMAYPTRMDLEALLPGCIDELNLELYKDSLQEKARELLKKEAPNYYDMLESTSIKQEGGVSPSVHAQRRWIQRKLKIEGVKTEADAEEYRKEHYEEVVNSLIGGFNSALEVWRDNTQDIAYYFDDDNLMYVVGNNNVIITIYEEDFGFSKSINRSIVFQQIEVLKEFKTKLDDRVKEHVHYEEGVAEEVQGLDVQMKSLQARLSDMKSRKENLLLSKSISSKEVTQKRVEFEKEYNKLFKTWKG